METRQINLPLDTARRWYEQGGELKEMALGVYTAQELIGHRLPKSWEEYRTMKGDDEEKANAALNFAYVSVREAFTDYHNVKKHIVLMKLHLLRDEYRNGWKPTWDKHCDKWCITFHPWYNTSTCSYRVVYHSDQSFFLSFQTEELAIEFLTNFHDLIEQASDLI